MEGNEILDRFEENREDVERVFRECTEVRLAYVFGSVVEGEVSDLSDIDFAVYLRNLADVSSVRMELFSELSPIIGDDIDIVAMNEASKLMNYNVVSTGKVLFQESDTFRAEAESRIVREYFDNRFYENRHVDQRLENFAEKGLA